MEAMNVKKWPHTDNYTLYVFSVAVDRSKERMHIKAYIAIQHDKLRSSRLARHAT